jgi:hypothetical protein
LKRRHASEFDTIFEQLCDQEGLSIQPQKRGRKKRMMKILDAFGVVQSQWVVIPPLPNIAKLLNLSTDATLTLFRELEDDGSIQVRRETTNELSHTLVRLN